MKGGCGGWANLAGSNPHRRYPERRNSRVLPKSFDGKARKYSVDSVMDTEREAAA